MQHRDWQIWRWLASDEAGSLLRAEDPDAASARLATLPNDFRQALDEQRALRPLLSRKMGADRPLLGTARSVQQASDRASARYKARQFPQHSPVYDLCCGIGSDLDALAARGPAVGVDCDWRMALCAAFNCRSGGAATVCSSALNVAFSGDAWLHIDPDRRPGERRVASAELCEPPLSVLLPLVARSAGAAIKLAPAAQIDEALAGLACREWIAAGRYCRQQVLWFGVRPGEAPRVATLVDSEGRVVGQFGGEAGERCGEAGAPGRFVYDVSPAIRAAGLTATWAAQHGAAALGGPAGFLTADHPIESAMATRFEVLQALPTNPKRLVAALKRAGLAPTAVKVRQLDWRPEALQKRISNLSGTPCELIIGRAATAKYVVAAQRCSVAA